MSAENVLFSESHVFFVFFCFFSSSSSFSFFCIQHPLTTQKDLMTTFICLSEQRSTFKRTEV